MIRVVIPVHNAAQELEDCLAAVQQTVADNQPMTVIDDASTDPQVGVVMDRFARCRPSTRIVRQHANLGFVQTVNAAMADCSEDVLLLNSDTLVTSGWLQAMEACAASDSAIATVTPFSNNAEICSIPLFCVNNPPPADRDAVASAVREASKRQYPDLPTAVGFCMLIRRAAIDALGLFDEAYGRGYGEENDFCRRAAKAGWRNVLCDDAYVVHLGGRSFAPLGLRPGGDNMATLVERFPDYPQLVADFIRRDPLRPLRDAIACRLAAP